MANFSKNKKEKIRAKISVNKNAKSGGCEANFDKIIPTAYPTVSTYMQNILNIYYRL